MFNLKTPCKNCPFRTDCPQGWLGTRRAAQIANALESDQFFPCHETTDSDDEGSACVVQKTQACAGATVLLEKLNLPNQMMRICEGLGDYDPKKMDMEAPVFGDFDEFIEHHTPGKDSPFRHR